MMAGSICIRKSSSINEFELYSAKISVPAARNEARIHISILVENQLLMKMMKLIENPITYPMNFLLLCFKIPIIGSQIAVERIHGIVMYWGKKERRIIEPITK
jgi:hypothetical protein